MQHPSAHPRTRHRRGGPQFRGRPAVLDGARLRGRDARGRRGDRAQPRHRGGVAHPRAVHRRRRRRSLDGRRGVRLLLHRRVGARRGAEHLARRRPHAVLRLPARHPLLDGGGPGNDYWVGSGTWINVRPFTEWVLLCMYDPAEGEPDTSDEALVALAQSTIGDPDVEVSIKQVSKWQINHVVADEYREGPGVPRRRRRPPAPASQRPGDERVDPGCLQSRMEALGGAARRGRDGALETYSQERQPVGRRVVDRAMKSVVDMGPIAQALGFSPDSRLRRDGRASTDSSATRRGVASSSRPSNCRTTSSTPSASNSASSTPRTGSFPPNPATMHGTGPTPGPRPPRRRAPPRRGHPTSTSTTFPPPGRGAAPHAWVDRDRRRLSTLDLVGSGGWTLITGHDDAGWAEAPRRSPASSGLPCAPRR